jgi:hypothetical protein
LVSCVIGPNEKLRPSMISTETGVLFFTKATLYCHISSLHIKLVDVLKSKNV